MSPYAMENIMNIRSPHYLLPTQPENQQQQQQQQQQQPWRDERVWSNELAEEVRGYHLLPDDKDLTLKKV